MRRGCHCSLPLGSTVGCVMSLLCIGLTHNTRGVQVKMRTFLVKLVI
jgi:hypothetical protein